VFSLPEANNEGFIPGAHVSEGGELHTKLGGWPAKEAAEMIATGSFSIKSSVKAFEARRRSGVELSNKERNGEMKRIEAPAKKRSF
jgi:hypothetical protein